MANQMAGRESAMGRPALQWLPFAVGCFFSLRPAFTMVLVRVFSLPPNSGATLSLTADFALFALACVDLLRLQPASTKLPRPSAPVHRWVILYSAFAGLSLVWSAAASVPASFAYWSGTSCDVSIVLLLLRGANALQVGTSTMKGYMVGACVIASIAWA